MKPDDLAVYDVYPQAVAALLRCCLELGRLPLDAMLAASSRITLTGALCGPDQTRAVDTDAVAQQRRVIEAAIIFRDTIGLGAS
jgi:hypothetical protein